MLGDLHRRILEIIAQPRLAALATLTDEDKPWVRYVMIQGGEDMKIRFASFVAARKVVHINRNPEVHLTCGITDPMVLSPYLQIQGRAFFTTDESERHDFWGELTASVFAGPDDPRYGVGIVVPYRIEYCIPGISPPEVWTR